MTLTSDWSPMAASPDVELSWNVLGELQPHTKYSILCLIFFLAVSLAMLPWLDSKASTQFENEGSSGIHHLRLPHLDNAKFIIVSCVIADHMSRSAYWPKSDLQHFGIRDFLLFHTRTLCFISGLVGRSPPNSQMFRKLIFRLVLPMLFFVGLFRMGELILNYSLRTGHFMPPGEFATNLKLCLGGLNIVKGWYLQALILWRIWGCMLMAFSPASRITIAVVMAITGGYTDWHQFCVARAMTFMPIYVAGQLFPWEAVTQQLQWSRNKAIFGTSVLMAVLVCESTIAAPLMTDMPDMNWEINASHVPGGISEASFLWARGLARNALEISKGMVFLLLICPRNYCFISAAGRFSLYSYLLHGPTTLILPWLFSTWLEGLVHGTHLVQICLWLGVLVVSACIAWVLASWPVRWVTGVFLEPTWAEKYFAAGEESHLEKFADAPMKLQS